MTTPSKSIAQHAHTRLAMFIVFTSMLLSACGAGIDTNDPKFDPDSGGTGSDVVTTTAIGPITSLKAITVNGVIFDPDMARISDERDYSVRRSDLRIGMMAEVVGTANVVAMFGEATSIRIFSEAIGLAHSVTEDGFVINGISVVVIPTTVVDGFEPSLTQGDRVEVFGLYDPTRHEIIATRVAASANSNEFKLRGLVSDWNAAARRFNIGTETVLYPASLSLPADFGDGMDVRIYANANPANGTWLIDDIRAVTYDTLFAGSWAEIRGVVTEHTGLGKFNLGGIPVDATQARVTGGSLTDIVLGSWIEVAGPLRDGSLIAANVVVGSGQNQQGDTANGGDGSQTGNRTTAGGTTGSDDSSTNNGVEIECIDVRVYDQSSNNSTTGLQIAYYGLFNGSPSVHFWVDPVKLFAGTGISPDIDEGTLQLDASNFFQVARDNSFGDGDFDVKASPNLLGDSGVYSFNYIDTTDGGGLIDEVLAMLKELLEDGVELTLTYTEQGVERQVCLNVEFIGGNPFSPVALDLNGDGEIGVTGETSSWQKDEDAQLGQTVEFDIDADGELDTIEWFDGSGDGILVDTAFIGENGEIDGAALFGDQGGLYDNGYQKLQAHDANDDGLISGEELDGLGLWVDDGDAVLEDGELLSAEQAGVSSISIDMQIVLDEQGRELMRSEATVNGQTIMTEDVWFAQGIDDASALTADEVTFPPQGNQ